MSNFLSAKQPQSMLRNKLKTTTQFARPINLMNKDVVKSPSQPVLPHPNEVKLVSSKEDGYARKPRPLGYKPYTLNDYKVIKTDKYYELKGLGAHMIGTAEWTRKREALLKRIEYAKLANQANKNKLPSIIKPRVEVSKEPSSRQRALEFARAIPKPPPKPKANSTPQPPTNYSSVLEQLEKKHSDYKQTVKEIRSILI